MATAEGFSTNRHMRTGNFAFFHWFVARLATERSSSFRASNYVAPISTMLIPGNGPRLSVFAFPLTRYLPRQRLTLAGVATT